MCGESPQEAPLCGTGRHGFAVQNVPHIFFLSCQKKSRRRSGGREQRYHPNLHTVQVWGNGFCENCCANEAVRTKSRAGYTSCLTLCAVTIKHQIPGHRQDTPCSSFRCR